MGTSNRKAAAAGSGTNSYSEYGFLALGTSSSVDSHKGQIRLNLGNGFKHATVTQMRLWMYRMNKAQMQSAGLPQSFVSYAYSSETYIGSMQVCEADTYYASKDESAAHALAYMAVNSTCPNPQTDGEGYCYGWYYWDITNLKDAIINHPGAYIDLRNVASNRAFFGVNGDEKDPYIEVTYSESDATDFTVSSSFRVPIELTREIPVTITPSGGVYADLKFTSLSSDYMTVDEDGNATCHEYGFFTAQVTMTPMNGSTPITKNVVVSCLEGLTVMYGVDGEYKECEVFYGQDGEWKQCRLYYGRNGEWVTHDRREPQIVILPSYA